MFKAAGIPPGEALSVSLGELVLFAVTAPIGRGWAIDAVGWIDTGFLLDGGIAAALQVLTGNKLYHKRSDIERSQLRYTGIASNRVDDPSEQVSAHRNGNPATAPIETAQPRWRLRLRGDMLIDRCVFGKLTVNHSFTHGSCGGFLFERSFPSGQR